MFSNNLKNFMKGSEVLQKIFSSTERKREENFSAIFPIGKVLIWNNDHFVLNSSHALLMVKHLTDALMFTKSITVELLPDNN